MTDNNRFRSDHILSYFQREWKVLLAVTISGLIYNLGLLAGPWFEGQMTGCLVNILKGSEQFINMLTLVVSYVLVILIVQSSRYIKRFYVRRFANNVNRRMKGILYGNLVAKSRASLKEEGEGDVMTKAILDVDDCAEGMRKFTTEIFDTGVALAAYIGMLFWYDWRLALLCMIFPPVSYVIAEKMKTVVQRTGAAYKKQSGSLSAATLDRAENAITYRVFGCESERQNAYEENLSAYEKSAVKANIWSTMMPPVYRIISMTGVLFILYFGQKNVLGTGWSSWDIAAFTTFLACFVKLSVKSSSAAKLFNAVHKAQVSWNRIRSLMQPSGEEKKQKNWKAGELSVEHLKFAYPDGKQVLDDISFSAKPGEIIGITGAVASGKSTLGKVFLCEYPYEGSIYFQESEMQKSEVQKSDVANEIEDELRKENSAVCKRNELWKVYSVVCERNELQKLSANERAGIVGYLGHDPELFYDTIENNIKMGEEKELMPYLKAVCLDREVSEMEDGVRTMIGTGGVRLSGGQAQRLALARTLYHKKPVLILDDPFSALDKNTEQEVFANLRKIAEDSIVLLISHRLYLFPELDQVLWLENGKAQTGTHAELMETVPEYAKLYLAQEGGAVDEEK